MDGDGWRRVLKRTTKHSDDVIAIADEEHAPIISAAPDLLATLKVLLAICEEGICGSYRATARSAPKAVLHLSLFASDGRSSSSTTRAGAPYPGVRNRALGLEAR